MYNIIIYYHSKQPSHPHFYNPTEVRINWDHTHGLDTVESRLGCRKVGKKRKKDGHSPGGARDILRAEVVREARLNNDDFMHYYADRHDLPDYDFIWK